jgi:hypothetical protein
MCGCAFSRKFLLCFAQNNWNFIGIFSLSSVNLTVSSKEKNHECQKFLHKKKA